MTLHLIDALPYVFRAFHSLPETLVDPRGASVQALYGWLTFLLGYLEAERPTHLGVAFDRSLNTSFRNEFYPAYKQNRELPPAALEAQLGACESFARALGLVVLADERFEADDWIASVLEGPGRQAERVVVTSSDKDLAQLVDARCTLYDFARGARMGPSEVHAKFGVLPAQIPDFLGLAGDAVDNIPGVRGVGAKSAAALLDHFGDLDDLYRRLDEVPDMKLRGARALAGKLADGRAAAFLSRRLATVSRDAPLPGALRGVHGLEGLRRTEPERERLEELCDHFGFQRLRARLTAG